MMTAQPHIQWMAPSPLWSAQVEAAPAQLQRPALLRFASDSFMEDLASTLATRPAKIADQVARGESFRARPLGTAAGWTPPPLPSLKLYQPAHGHFYLVTACLVCRLPGLPDRSFNLPQGERAFFVLRRLSSGSSEYAWATEPGGKPGWRSVPAGAEQSVHDGEEQLPLFPVVFTDDGRRRRLLAGLVPTSSRETFQAGAELSPLVVDKNTDPRVDELENRVTGVLDSLRDPQIVLDIRPEQANETSLFVLLDLADFLVTHQQSVWLPVISGTSAVPSSAPGFALYEQLRTSIASHSTTWLDAMRAVWKQREAITRGDAPNPALPYDLRATALDRTALTANVKSALGTYVPPIAPPTNVPVPKLGSGPGVRYAIRMVFERPWCGPLVRPIVSERTEPFELASFFDFDAPARSIRISLPVDTSPASLRNYQKNVGFVISDRLKQQMNCVKDATGALKGDISCGQSIDLGLICSFSIPIITIVALLLLMIMVILLNIVFWWLPFFRICLPVGIKAKG
jgi:hypothetical protein